MNGERSTSELIPPFMRVVNAVDGLTPCKDRDSGKNDFRGV